MSRLDPQKMHQVQHKKKSFNSCTIVLTWPQRLSNLQWQVCSDVMVLIGIAGTISSSHLFEGSTA